MDDDLLEPTSAEAIEFVEIQEEVLATAMSTITWSIMPEPSN